MTPEMEEYLRWDDLVAGVADGSHRYILAVGGSHVSPSDDELRRAVARMALLWNNFTADEKAQLVELIRQRDEQ